MKLQYIISGLALCSLWSCKPQLHTEAPYANGVDFSRYVAVGNSLTAGFADGTLYKSGQQNSYPSILASQFMYVGGGAFKQPLLNGDWGFPNPKLVLGIGADCKGTPGLGPVPNPAMPDTAGDATNISAAGPYNNLGVPGIRCVDMLFPGYAFLNPYAKRLFANPSGRALDELKRMTPTFFTLWLGSNDVLGYATAGGEGSMSGVVPGDISPMPQFSVSYDSVVNAMTASGAKGVLINIPDITAIPFFTTIPAKGLVLTTTQAAQLNTAYSGTGISFIEGANNFIIQDPSVPVLGMRKIKDNELLLLTIPQDSLKCGGWGSIKPIPKKYVLDGAEIKAVQNATLAFNAFILQEAQKHGLAYVDMNSYIKTLVSGIKFNGVDFNTSFVTGGAFSLDGVHLTPRGYALAANEIIRNINLYYGTNIPAADVNKYGGIRFP